MSTNKQLEQDEPRQYNECWRAALRGGEGKK